MNSHGNFLSCTLTGAGDDVAPEALLALSRKYPFAEWAVLYSPQRAGTEGRYPSLDWLRRFMDMAANTGIACAVHLCGDAVDQFINGDLWVTQFVDRVQLNFHQDKKPKNLAGIEAAMARFRRPVITQHNQSNADVVRGISSHNHQLLFDASGGRGVEIERFPSPIPGKRACGYAGGLGPHNISEKLPQIAAAAGRHAWWIDMEQRVRTADDRFDLVAVEAVLKQTADWLGEADTLDIPLFSLGARRPVAVSAGIMTIAEFRDTGRAVVDLRAELNDDSFEEVSPGRLYHGPLYIEGSDAMGWSLTINNETWENAPLEELEEHLYQYGVDEMLLKKGGA